MPLVFIYELWKLRYSYFTYIFKLSLKVLFLCEYHSEYNGHFNQNTFEFNFLNTQKGHCFRFSVEMNDCVRHIPLDKERLFLLDNITRNKLVYDFTSMKAKFLRKFEKLQLCRPYVSNRYSIGPSRKRKRKMEQKNT